MSQRTSEDLVLRRTQRQSISTILTSVTLSWRVIQAIFSPGQPGSSGTRVDFMWKQQETIAWLYEGVAWSKQSYGWGTKNKTKKSRNCGIQTTPILLTCHLSLVTHHSSLVTCHSLVTHSSLTRHSSLTCHSLVTHSSLVIRHSLVTCHLSLVTRHS